jgi:hypothetical protein
MTTTDGASADGGSASDTRPVDAAAKAGSSPYATGGGGVSLAHRIAAIYLASLLTGERRTEASELPVRRVSFQTGPAHPVDDLFVECSDGATEVSIAIACRASPDFVSSDSPTVKLVGSLLEEVAKFDTDTHQVAVAAAGWTKQWQQLAVLCDIARSCADAAAFAASLAVEQRWSKQVRGRFRQFLLMVNAAAGGTETDAEVLSRAFRLLSRLHILGFAVQNANDGDRTAAATALDSVAADIVDGVVLRDRLEVEATRYDATGAVVDMNLLRRDLHAMLRVASTRTARAWEALAEHRVLATATVRANLGQASPAVAPLDIAFSDRREVLIAAIQAAGSNAAALVVAGESGTGKSALTLSCIQQLEAEEPESFEALVVNFRALPETSMEFRSAIGASISEVLAELSAPIRVLVIDAADTALERSASLLNDLILSAAQAGVGVVAISADTAREFVEEQIALGFPGRVPSFVMQPLSDTDIQLVADHFPLLRTVLRDLPAASLLRRLVVLDLLVRTGVELSGPMSEWDCLQLIWSKIVRQDGRPGSGSPEAREQTLLAVAAATLNLPASEQPFAFESAAVNSLRRDYLLTPPSPYLSRPEFAHDEVRRYAVAILLVRATSLVDTLRVAGVPRWALSATTLACRGQLRDPRLSAPTVFVRMVKEFSALAAQYSPRWFDLPVEAVLDTPSAYECLKAELTAQSPEVRLDDVVRIINQRHRTRLFPDPVVAAPVIRLLLDQPEPWRVSRASFALLADWLQSLVIAELPAGIPLRVALRDRLLAHWDSFPPRAATEVDDADDNFVELGFGPGSRRRRVLPYEVTNEEYIECLALLGPDINEAVEQRLLAVADDAPDFLAPAADSPLSARAIALHAPELLGKLMEAYYVDDEAWGWDHRDGVREHHGRSSGAGLPFYNYYFGGFWSLLSTASPKTSVRVLNRILNHGARARVDILENLGGRRSEPVPGAEPDDDSGADLNLDGVQRRYVGDSHVWSWYRGTSVGPYAGTSALLAMERVAENWLDGGASPSAVVAILLEGCENLAVPGMLFGLLTRHIDVVTDELDAFLAEPRVWELEFARVANEASTLGARTDGLKRLDRRRWSPREVCIALMAGRGEERVQQLKRVGDQLIENGNRLGVDAETTASWAAHLDVDQYTLTAQDDQVLIQVNPPAELEASQAQFAQYQEQVNTDMRLQNRYWGSAKHDADYVAPTSAEIAGDLAEARELLGATNDIMPIRPLNAVAHVVRTAIQRAAAGAPEALGDEAEFAARFVLDIALSFETSQDLREEGQYFDLGADRAAAHALPALATPVFADILAAVGATVADVARAGEAVARKAPLESRLFLARGCDVIWTTPCQGDPCIHQTALGWLLDAARGAEIGPWEAHRHTRVFRDIDGDVPKRLRELDGTRIDLRMLDASIRGLGTAAESTDHCSSTEAAQALASFVDAHARSLLARSRDGQSADPRDTHALIVARALVDNFATHGDPQPLLRHLDALSVNAVNLSGILHGLAGAGAENPRRAAATREIWPTIFGHALAYASQDPNPYRARHWGDWAAAALLPEPRSWARGVWNELAGPAIDWVNASDLLGHIDQWIPVGRGERMCVDALIRVLNRLPLAEQVAPGLGWITDLCTQNGKVVVKESALSNDWLKKIRSTAEELDRLSDWQKLVDSMVVAGNEGLAPYSR